MQPIENTQTDELIAIASNELLEEARRDGIRQVKSLIIAIRQLSGEIVKLNKEVEKKTEQLTKKQAEMEKLRNGDWNVLQTPMGQQEKQPEKQDG